MPGKDSSVFHRPLAPKPKAKKKLGGPWSNAAAQQDLPAHGPEAQGFLGNFSKQTNVASPGAPPSPGGAPLPPDAKIGKNASLRALLAGSPDGLAQLGLGGFGPGVGAAAAAALSEDGIGPLTAAGLSKEDAVRIYTTASAAEIGLENSTYQVDVGSNATVADNVGRDQIVLTGVGSFDDLAQNRVANDLILQTPGGAVTIPGFYDPNNDSIDRIVLGDSPSGLHADTTLYREELLIDEDAILNQAFNPYGQPESGSGKTLQPLTSTANKLSQGSLDGVTVQDLIQEVSSGAAVSPKEDPSAADIAPRRRAQLGAILEKYGAAETVQDTLVQGTVTDPAAFAGSVKAFALDVKQDKVRAKAIESYAQGTIDDAKTLIFGADKVNDSTLSRGFRKVSGAQTASEDYGDGKSAGIAAQADKAEQELANFNTLSGNDQQTQIENFAKNGQKSSTLGKVLGVVAVVAPFFPGVGTIVGAVAAGLAAVADGGSIGDGLKAGFGSYLTAGGFGGGAATKLAGVALQGGDSESLLKAGVGVAIGQSSLGSSLADSGVSVGAGGVGFGSGGANLGIDFDGNVSAGLSVNDTFSVGYSGQGGFSAGLSLNDNASVGFSEGGGLSGSVSIGDKADVDFSEAGGFGITPGTQPLSLDASSSPLAADELFESFPSPTSGLNSLTETSEVGALSAEGLLPPVFADDPGSLNFSEASTPTFRSIGPIPESVEPSGKDFGFEPTFVAPNNDGTVLSEAPFEVSEPTSAPGPVSLDVAAEPSGLPVLLDAFGGPGADLAAQSDLPIVDSEALGKAANAALGLLGKKVKGDTKKVVALVKAGASVYDKAGAAGADLSIETAVELANAVTEAAGDLLKNGQAKKVLKKAGVVGKVAENLIEIAQAETLGEAATAAASAAVLSVPPVSALLTAYSTGTGIGDVLRVVGTSEGAKDADGQTPLDKLLRSSTDTSQSVKQAGKDTEAALANAAPVAEAFFSELTGSAVLGSLANDILTGTGEFAGSIGGPTGEFAGGLQVILGSPNATLEGAGNAVEAYIRGWFD